MVALAQLRSAGTCFNPSMVDPKGRDYTYTPPYICVTHMAEVWHEGKMTNPACESVSMQFPWDHTEWSLYEAVEAARKGGGKVYVQQDVIELGCLPEESDSRVPDWTRWADEGFAVEVWPNFTGKDKYAKSEGEAG